MQTDYIYHNYRN